MIPRDVERPGTIALQWDGKYQEGRAGGDGILPGHLLEITTVTLDGDSVEKNIAQLPPYVKKNSVAATPNVMVALEPRLEGDSFDGTVRVEKEYTEVTGTDSSADGFYAGDIVPYLVPKKGDVCLCRVAEDAHLTFGALLKAHTDGTLIAQGGSGTAIAFVAEDFDFGAVGNDDVPLLLRVQFL